MSKSARVRAILAEAPATVAEIAIETGWSMRDAHVAVWVLNYTGQAESTRSIPSGAARGKKHHKLWELTRRGRYLLRRDRA